MSGKNSAAQFKETYGAASTFVGGMLDPFKVGIIGLNPKHPTFVKGLDCPLDPDWNADLWDQARLDQAEKDPVPPDAILAIGGPRHAIKVTNRRGMALCVDGRRTILGCRLAVQKQKAAKVDPAEYIELIAIVDKSKDLDVSVRLANSGRKDDPPWVKAACAVYLDQRKKPHAVIRACLDNCDSKTLANYLAYGDVIPEIKAMVENTDLPKDQRVPFIVAVEIGYLGAGEVKRQKLALDYLRTTGAHLRGEAGRDNVRAVCLGIKDGSITKVPQPQAPSPAPITGKPAAQAAPSTKPTATSQTPPAGQTPNKSSNASPPPQRAKGDPVLTTVRTMKPKLIQTAFAMLESTGDEPLETEAGRAAYAVLAVITGQDPTGEGLAEFPEIQAAFRHVLPSAQVAT